MQYEDAKLEWFPMRVTYNRELKVKENLEKLNIESFVPMHYEAVGIGSDRQIKLVPAINNLIFVHALQKELTELKISRRELQPLRYMMRPVLGQNGKHEIIRVPDRQMENFMRVASIEDDRVMFLKYEDFLSKPGQRVKITTGFFTGVEGVVKRIFNNRRVVVQIEGIAAVAIAHVPKEYLTPIDNEH